MNPTKPQSLLLTALQVAQSQIGVHEQPLGSNTGPEVNQYLASVGLKPGNSWCAAFVYWCYQQAAQSLGMANPVIRTGGVMDHWNRAFKPAVPHRLMAVDVRENPALVKPGMIGILLIAPLTQAGHTFIVESINPNSGELVTVEGNSNELASREGCGVFRLHRRTVHDKTLMGFLDYSGVH